MRIVIVEDEKKVREGMAAMIDSHTRHTVAAEAANGKDGLEIILKLRPDLVITDIRMPVLDGLEMIRALKEKNLSCHIIVLSGYSEFEYAKKAITYGVDEYLLKPLTASDIQNALRKVEDKMEQEILALKGTPESCLRDIIEGNTEPDLIELFEFQKNMKFLMAACYFGSMTKEYEDRVHEFFQYSKENFPDKHNGKENVSSNLHIYSFYQGNSRIYYALISGFDYLDEFEEEIYRKLVREYRGKSRHPLWACTHFSDSGKIYQCAEELKGYLDYGITAPGFPGWYTGHFAEECKWEQFKTPVQILQKIKSDICQEHMEEAGKNLDLLAEYLQGHSFRKEEIRQALIRCYFMVTGLLQDLDKKRFQKLQSYNLEHSLNQIMTWEEMKQNFGRIRDVLMQGSARRQDISNYIIVKVLNYIQEHYSEKIVLDEIAVQMGLTPEYLSTLFNREVKENFTVFLKKFRIDHAKRLLTGTDMKIYEVAQEVGYSDAKYFIKVFKEKEGISPGDYREMQH